MADAYRSDLAYIHDSGYGGFAAAAAPVLLDALRAAGLERGRVIDLGCGSGILSAAVAAAGYDIVGFDISRDMLALARQRLPQAQFKMQSLFAADIPPCVAVAAVGECCNYLFDEGNTDAALHRLFRRIFHALSAGGLFLFDVAGPGRVLGRGSLRTFREGGDWAVLVTTEEDRQRRLLTRQITSFRKVGRHYRRSHEVHRLRLLPRAEVARQLRKLGFRVRIVNAYAALRFPPGYAGFLARKPG
jgi:SAM-dependent methyltransferase